MRLFCPVAANHYKSFLSLSIHTVAFGCFGEMSRLSKLKLQRELNRAWSAVLVDRGYPSQTASQHQSRLTKRAAQQAIRWTRKVGMVEDIEKLRAKLQVDALREVELPAQSKVELPDAKSSQRIPDERALASQRTCQQRWRNERCHVESFSTRGQRIRQVKRNPGH